MYEESRTPAAFISAASPAFLERLLIGYLPAAIPGRPLIGYLPPVLQEIREFQAIMACEDPEIHLLCGAVAKTRDDQFIISATEYGVRRYESILDITPKLTFTLEERKFAILTRMNEQLPFTFRMLHRMLAELCGPGGYVALLEPGIKELHVKLALTAVNNYNVVELMLRRVCPANLLITISIMYNKHMVLSQFTHEQLAAYSHHQLRNEVFD